MENQFRKLSLKSIQKKAFKKREAYSLRLDDRVGGGRTVSIVEGKAGKEVSTNKKVVSRDNKVSENKGFIGPEKPEKEPLWLFEGAMAVIKLLDEKTVEIHPVQGDDELEEDVAIFKAYWKKVAPLVSKIMEKHGFILHSLEHLLKENPYTLNVVAIYLEEVPRQDKGTAEKIQRFFQPIFEGQLDKSAPLDFESLYRKAQELWDDPLIVMEIANFYLNFDEWIQALANLLEEVAKVLEKNYPMIQPLYEKSVEAIRLSDVQVHYPISQDFSYVLNHFIISIIIPNSSSILDFFEGSNYLFCGMLFVRLAEFRAKGRSLSWRTSLLKAMGDPVRYGILQKAMIAPVYLSELAEAFNLKPSTISHHINALVQESLLSLADTDYEGRRMYLELNKDILQELYELLAKDFHLEG